jgi:G3E family GTPase
MTIDDRALDELLADAAACGAVSRSRALSRRVEALRRPGDDRVRLAFVGEFCNGKTQVINSLLGDVYLPASATPTTRVVTEIAYGTAPEALLVREDGVEQPIALESLAQAQGDSGFRRARVRLPVEWLRDFVLIDTPGIGEPQDLAAEVVYQELPRADAIIFVLHAQAALKQSERRFLAERLLRSDRSRILFVLNQIDHLESKDVGELEGYVRRQLAQLVPHPVLLKYSALEALRGRLDNDPELLERSHYGEVSAALISAMAADRRRLRQAATLAWLRDGLEAARAEGIERQEARELTLRELDERLGRLDTEQARFQARLDRVCDHAANHLDLVSRYIETELQSLRLRVDHELPKLVDNADPVDLRRQLPFYLEHLVKSYLEWLQPSLDAFLAEVYTQIDRELSEAVADALRSLGLEPGYLAPALRPRPANYDRVTQASRTLGVMGVIALVIGDFPLALGAGMLVVSQVLRVLARRWREAAEREQLVDAGKRAMRSCLERAREELAGQVEEHKSRLLAAIRAEGERRMAGATQALHDARAAREAAEADREPAGADWQTIQPELERLIERTRRFEEALEES